MNSAEWKYLLAGAGNDINVPESPVVWIDGTSWPEIYKYLAGAA
jgi:hypothetical protein